LGNLGLTLIHLERHSEALQIFEQIIDVSDDPTWLWPAYYNIGQIYRNWGKIAISDMYHGMASKIRPEADERLADRRRPQDPGSLVARLADAIIKTEIDMEDQKT
jgi:tetratricopeptide (TPR) repeat protein